MPEGMDGARRLQKAWCQPGVARSDRWKGICRENFEDRYRRSIFVFELVLAVTDRRGRD
ncbi:MAG: hypothetical protein IPJ67_00015 [Candidatus Moraniibacteriota bacterium]|nr:MAG: hypothetical protein IPJ67_00015 [Candidatus Moranbacteria bacterium]